MIAPRFNVGWQRLPHIHLPHELSGVPEGRQAGGSFVRGSHRLGGKEFPHALHSSRNPDPCDVVNQRAS